MIIKAIDANIKKRLEKGDCMTTEPIEIFKKNYIVTEDDLSSETGQMAVAKILVKSLETSYAHDRYLTISGQFFDALIKENETWVVTQYLIKIHQLPQIDDEITISTQVTLANSFFVNRYFTLYKGEELLVEFHSQYVGIDTTTRKAIRLDVKDLESYSIIDSTKNQRFTKIKMPQDATNIEETIYKIQKEDIDYNHHVNNTVYINWCLNVLPETFKTAHRMTQIDVKYGQEVLPNATVKINTYQQFDLETTQIKTIHFIDNIDTQREACQIQIHWQPSEEGKI